MVLAYVINGASVLEYEWLLYLQYVLDHLTCPVFCPKIVQDTAGRFDFRCKSV